MSSVDKNILRTIKRSPSAHAEEVVESNSISRPINTKRVGVLIVHGINTSEVAYSEAFRAQVKAKLQEHGVSEPNDVCYEEVFWAAITKSTQSEFKLNKTIFTPHMESEPIRSFIIEALGDAAAYQNVRPFPLSNEEESEIGHDFPTTYQQIQKQLDRSVENLAAKLDADSPLIIVAHSFGGWVVLRYVADIQKHVEINDNELTKLDDQEQERIKARRRLANSLDPTRDVRLMRTLSSVITFGCNVPIFAFSLDPRQAKPMEFCRNAWQRAEAAEPDKGRRLWLNFYNRHDVLSFPLRPISKHFEDIVFDYEIAKKGKQSIPRWVWPIFGWAIFIALIPLLAFALVGALFPDISAQSWSDTALAAAGMLPIAVIATVIVGRYFSDRLDFAYPHTFYWTNEKVICATAETILEWSGRPLNTKAISAKDLALDNLKMPPPRRPQMRAENPVGNDPKGGNENTGIADQSSSVVTGKF